MANQSDDSFKPKLGRMRDMGHRTGKRYTSRILNAVGQKNFKSRHGFSGRNIGRGNLYAASRSQGGYTRFQQRRVVIKARFVKLAGTGIRMASAHLRYVQRDGVSQEGAPGKSYDATSEEVDGEKFLEQSKTDRHQFRFIVSPEDANELGDLQTFTRDLMQQMELDLDSKLEWVAVDHYNTDNPHTHIIVRGIADDGKDLIIAREYLSTGLRERASDLMTDELGPRQNHEIQTTLRREITQDRFTSIDRKLLQGIESNILDIRGQPKQEYARFNHNLKLARLQKLNNLQLAQQIKSGVWQLSEKMETTLRELGMRSDIIKTMHAEMTRTGKPSLSKDYEIFVPTDQPNKKIVGRLISKGFSDEFNDRYYLIVEGIDGKTHYADIGQVADIEAHKTGSIVELTSKNTSPRKTDLTISKIANANEGIYSEQLHARIDPRATNDFIHTHVRRLESLRRQNVARRFSDGSWEVSKGFLDKILDIGKAQAKRSPIAIITRSQFSLEVQSHATGATWLDRTLLDRGKMPLNQTGFGAEVTKALKIRQAYLIEQGFANQTTKGIRFQQGLLNTLKTRELTKVASSIASKIDKMFLPTKPGDKIEGIYSKPVELVSGRYALIEKSKQFTLVPWRSVLENVRGKSVSGIINKGGGISWDIGPKKGMGI